MAGKIFAGIFLAGKIFTGIVLAGKIIPYKNLIKLYKNPIKTL